MRTTLLVLLLTVIWPPALEAAEPFRVRVLSYNIHHGEGVDGQLDLPRIARVIREVAPDVVALQEVDRGTMRTRGVDQPAELGRLTDMHVVFERNIDFQGGQYGNAILSKLPVVRHENVALPSLYEGEQRGVLICELQPTALERPLLFLCTHLDYRPADAERLASAEQINQRVSARPDVPAILAGDLNATPDSAVLARFAEAWRSTATKELPTFPVAQPTRQIDYILYRPADRWTVREVRVLEEAVASDHRALLAVLELRP